MDGFATLGSLTCPHASFEITYEFFHLLHMLLKNVTKNVIKNVMYSFCHTKVTSLTSWPDLR